MRPRLASSVTGAAFVAAAGYSVTAALSLVAVLAQDPASDAHCPPCEVLPWAWKAIAVAGALVSILAFTVSVIGLLKREGLEPGARVALGLLAWGAPLLLLFGVGVGLVVPGLALLALALRGTPLPWLAPATMLAAFALTVVVGGPIDETASPDLALVLVTYALAESIPVAWAILALQVRRKGWPPVPPPSRPERRRPRAVGELHAGASRADGTDP